MAQATGTLDELRQMIGAEGLPCTVEIDRTTVRLLLAAVGDASPAWLDADGKTREAPPYLLCATMLSGRGTWPAIPFPFRRFVDGGAEWEVHEPVRPGDEVTAVTRFSGLTEREGRSGKMWLLTFETTQHTQHGELVGASRSTVIGFDPVG